MAASAMELSKRSIVSSYRQLLLTICWLVVVLQVAAAKMSADEVKKHLDLGKKLLSEGDLTGALTHYHSAVEGDPTNYLTFYKRATVYLAIGRSKSALPDLDKTLELRPDFSSARLQRASVLLKRSKLDAASADYEHVLKQQPDHAEAREQLDSIAPIRNALQNAYAFKQQRDCNGVVAVLEPIIEKLPWDADIREMRADCYMEMGMYHKAISDIRVTTKLISDNTAAYFRLSKVYYSLGDLEDTLREVRECLKLDPDHKECYPFYKKVKKLNKQFTKAEELISQGQYEEAIGKLDSAMKTESSEYHYEMRVLGRKCHSYYKMHRISEAVKVCSDVLRRDPDNVNALCDRAETYILDEKFQDAINDFQAATKIEGHPQQADEGLQRAQKLLKQSQKRDYYKILGVKRSCTKGEVIKAYRRKAMKWHPDHYKGKDKKLAEKMFIDIAAAKEVLTNPEKRAKFDQGEDPLDPEQQSQQGFHGSPFGGGFPFGGDGGGGHFKFHFG
eukprot:scpid55139/ scgid18723/ DnaJ homolog subfamily C member 3; Interferon-induced, double-stranded RNA-activated protein kinase inhibitor; Protein kinase inhibitor of 58 kDa